MRLLKAKHSKIARLVFNPYINRLIKKSFSNFYLANELPSIPSDKSLLITPNHISWWDGFFVDFLARKMIDKKLHLMMLESSLKKYWFFNKLGAYSIEPERNSSVLETTKYTREILTKPKNFVVTYPQGEIEPFEKRPLQIKEGIKLFLKDAAEQTEVLPVGFKIQPFNEKNPAVVCRFGKLLNAEDVINDFDLFINSFTSNLDKLNEAVFTKNFQKDILLDI